MKVVKNFVKIRQKIVETFDGSVGACLISWCNENSKASQSTETCTGNGVTRILMMASSNKHRETGNPKTDVEVYGRPVFISKTGSNWRSFSDMNDSSDEGKQISKLVCYKKYFSAGPLITRRRETTIIMFWSPGILCKLFEMEKMYVTMILYHQKMALGTLSSFSLFFWWEKQIWWDLWRVVDITEAGKW